MEEYLMDKCPTCGHEKRGKKVIRLAGEHAKQWKTIQRQLTRNTTVVLLGGLLLGFASGAGAGLAAWWYLQPHWSEEARAVLSIVTFVLGYLLPVFLVFIPLCNRRDKTLFSLRDTILINYGISKDKDPAEPYVVVTE